MPQTGEFFINVNDTPKRLFISRPESIHTTALSPCCMTPDDVDYEMSMGKNTEMLEICGMNQESLEYFVEHYGKTYRYLSFFKCQLIRDFSPLADLSKLEAVSIFWNIRSEKLWNMERNTALRSIRIADAKRMTLSPELLKTSKALESVSLSGSLFSNFPLSSLDCFASMPALKQLQLSSIRLVDKKLDALDSLPVLERFDFDAGMLTTEAIAWLVAKYPRLAGRCLCAYCREEAITNDVRVCGYRKPGLDLPEQQKRLDKYVAEFNALVEKYRKEIESAPI